MQNSSNIDHASFSQMYNSLYHKVFSYVSFRINNFDDATDIVQEVFVTAYKTIHNWPKPLQDHVAKKYLFIIARSRMIDFWKKASNRYEVKNFEIIDQYGEEIDFFSNVQDDNPLPEELFEQNENKKLALKMLEILSPNDREIIILKYIEDLPYNEISEILKTSEEVVRKRVSRALQKVKESLKN